MLPNQGLTPKSLVGLAFPRNSPDSKGQSMLESLDQTASDTETGSRFPLMHLFAGGMGGTAGAVITCPLEVVKTRQQSSVATFQQQVVVTRVSYIPPQQVASAHYTTCSSSLPTTTTTTTATAPATQSRPRASVGLVRCIRHILQNEGPRGLFKGLGPNLIGVAPSRAIYFCSYAQAKSFFNSTLVPDTPLVHILSASCAGFIASTATNPIWFIKTRLQLDQKRNGSLTATECIRQIYQTKGIKGFYKGMTASYYGISETVIHFVIYEHIKASLREFKGVGADDQRSPTDFLEFMAAGATSKTIATCLGYPHEVVRTRLRQEGNKYRGFWQTLGLVAREEGVRAMYRGICTQLVRQIPNTAIVMSTYEAVVYLCSRHL